MSAQLASCQEAAIRLNVPVTLVRALAKNGDVPVLKVPGARPRVDVEDVRRALQKHTQPARTPAPPVDLEFKTAG